MDGTRLQALASKGYGIAGRKTGTDYAQYRPSDALDPLATVLATLSASFDAKAPYGFAAPNEYGDARWYGLLDTSAVQPGDYLTGQGGTFFIAAVQPLLPAFCINCNATLSVLHVPASAAVGVQIDYSAVYADAETEIMAGWPASLLFGGQRSQSEARLPGELALPAFTVLLPAFAGVTIQPSDVLRDSDGVRYVVQAAELSDLGWRLNARRAAA